MYEEINLFMTDPVMPMHGRMDDSARARRHDLAYARTKPVMKAALKFITSATFSDIPCCTRSAGENGQTKHAIPNATKKNVRVSV